MTILMDDRITPAQLEAMAEADPLRRYELSLEGTVEGTMTPRSRHNWITMKLALWLSRGLPDADDRIQQDTGVLVRRRDTVGYRQPDLMLFTEQPPDDVYVDPELVILVVEVVSPATRHTDFAEKVVEYAASGIPYYWIVDEAEKVHLHRLDPGTGTYRTPEVVGFTDLLAGEPRTYLD